MKYAFRLFHMCRLALAESPCNTDGRANKQASKQANQATRSLATKQPTKQPRNHARKQTSKQPINQLHDKEATNQESDKATQANTCKQTQPTNQPPPECIQFFRPFFPIFLKFPSGLQQQLARRRVVIFDPHLLSLVFSFFLLYLPACICICMHAYI